MYWVSCSIAIANIQHNNRNDSTFRAFGPVALAHEDATKIVGARKAIAEMLERALEE